MLLRSALVNVFLVIETREHLHCCIYRCMAMGQLAEISY